MLKDNLIEVEEHIKKACEKSGRNPEDVCLVAVSKTKPEEMLMEVYDCGIRQFGENYVQEMVDKVDDLPKDITWHMIGHLQRNKVKYVVGRAAMIHSVDSERLAVAISEEAVFLKSTLPIVSSVMPSYPSTEYTTIPGFSALTVLKRSWLPVLETIESRLAIIFSLID